MLCIEAALSWPQREYCLCRAVSSPHGKTVRRSSAKAKDSRKDFVAFSQSELREDPGVYEVTVISRANVESDYILDIQEAALLTVPQLHEDDEVALQKVAIQDMSSPELLSVAYAWQHLVWGISILARPGTSSLSTARERPQ